MDTDEFVFHTPSIKAAKFWPGNLGVQATHACIFARCIAGGKDFGVQSFVVQVRDFDTFEPLPGIEIGDIGTKLGYNGADNGYLQFTHHRTPRDALLSRFVSLSKQGKFALKANPKMMYQIMVQTRIAILFTGCFLMQQCAKIATRYAVCRRQFATIQGSDEERALLDYQLHMDTIGRNLCIAMTMQLNVGDIAALELQS